MCELAGELEEDLNGWGVAGRVVPCQLRFRGAFHLSGARVDPSWSVTESKTDLQAQPTVVHCPFCLSENRVYSFDERCWNCGLELARLLAKSSGVGARSVQPAQIALEPSTPEPSKAKRTPRKKRLTKMQRQKLAELERQESALWFLEAPQTVPQPASPAPIAPPHYVQPALPAAPEFYNAAATDPNHIFPVDDETEHGCDATIVAPRAGVATQWALELEGGGVVWLLADHVVVGRRPDATGDATPVTINDATKTLSRSHARLRRDVSSDTWTIEDMGAANGVATVNCSGDMTSLLPGVPAHAPEYLQLGTLRTRLIRVAYPGS